MKKDLGLRIAAPLLAIAFAMGVSALLLQVTGNSAGDTFRVIVEDGFSRTYIVDTVNRAAPYYIAGVAIAIAFKMNLFYIGVEGAYRLAALIGATVGAAVSLPALLHVPLILVASMATGALWALIPALLKVTRGVSEVISSIMLNAISLGVAAYMLGTWFRQPASQSPVLGTRPIDDSGRLPELNGLLRTIGIDVPDAIRVQSYVVVAIAVGIAFYVLIWRSRFGYDLRASGENPEAAAASGVNTKRTIVAAMVLSGAVAGLIGLNNIMGSGGRYTDVTVVGGLGFTGIAIALLGRNNPIGIAFAALLWAFMDAVGTPLANAGLPKQVTGIMQGITVLSVVIAYEVVRRIGLRRQAIDLRRSTEGDGAQPPPGHGPEVAPA
ncbi:MAG: ABC transporter permease [Actinobacteria bacterium]|nr:ABC transporter permease [Actinomycetota bacterium]